MEKLTVAKLLEIKKSLKETEIKPYKGMIGLGLNGFFQINSESELNLLQGVK